MKNIIFDTGGVLVDTKIDIELLQPTFGILRIRI